ncbi:conserved hypothetical protein [Trichinella spiralis]|uniref:hypothetical protein n=1 Tax=Trichinella spiralis TaxID=6334 RepID=UPI0001EFC7D2|nr:conserved hypothetical protein [Trichinella spiralis]
MQVLLKLDVFINSAEIKQKKKAQSCVVRTDGWFVRNYRAYLLFMMMKEIFIKALAVQKQFWLAVVNHQSAIGIVASNQPAFLNGAAIAKISTISSRCRTLNAQFGRRFPQRTVVHGKLTSLASQLASL